MANEYYNHGGAPSQGSNGSSTVIRAEFDSIVVGMNKLPPLAGNALKFVTINAGGTAMSVASFTPAASGLNGDITQMTALTTALTIAQGGTNSTTPAAALVSLGERTGSTGSLINPAGTTAQRDVSPVNGYSRYNLDNSNYEVYAGTWKSFAFSGANADLTSVSALASINGSWPSGFKNKIIGGDFTTNPFQRGNTFTAITAGYTADRWVYGLNTPVATAICTLGKIADSPTAVQSGVYTAFSFGQIVTTAKPVLATNDYSVIYQKIEGYNIVPFGFGQAGTRKVTLSFWVKSTKIGINCVGFRNVSLGTRSYVAEYTINSSNIWEYKTITIPVDTTGSWNYDNTGGLDVLFSSAGAAGSTFITTPNTWQAGNFYSTANQVNGLDAVNNVFWIALVQLEAGSVATPFETRSIGQETDLCQRYYEVGASTASQYSGTSGSNNYTPVPFHKTKRAVPTMAGGLSGGGGYSSASYTPNLDAFSITVISNVIGSVAFNYTFTATAEL